MKLFKEKICCVGDIHLGVHQASSMWHTISLNFARWLRKELKEQNIKDIIITGDVLDDRNEIAVTTLHYLPQFFRILDDFNIIILVGNHDAYYKDNSTVHSLSILKSRKNITVVDKPIVQNVFDKTIGFCPWGTPISQVPKCDILIGHFEIQNFNFNTTKICEFGIQSNDLLSKSKLILSGHFHKRQHRKYSNGEIIYTGNPFQMDFNDIQDQKGFYILDLSEKHVKYEFIENNISPIHVKVNLSHLEKLKKLAKDKGWSNLAIKIIIDKDIKTNLLDKIIASINFEAPFSLTTDYLNKFNIGDNIILTNELGDLKIKDCIIEYIESLDIDNKEDVIKKTVHLYNQFI